jgi:hypothetical protein
MTTLRHAALANFLWALPATRPVAAQQSPVQPVSWSLSLGLGGNALFGPSLGAEIVWYDAFGLRAGVGYDWYSPTRVVPLEAVGLFGGRGSQLEVAIGVTIATEGKGDPWNLGRHAVVLHGLSRLPTPRREWVPVSYRRRSVALDEQHYSLGRDDVWDAAAGCREAALNRLT